jgi:hypothetical protein
MNRILIDCGRDSTTLWFEDGFTVLKGSLMEVAEKIYNMATIKYVNEENPYKQYYIKQEYALYIDYFGHGQVLEDVLIRKYKLKVDRCTVYKNHKDYNCDKQQVIELHKDAFRFSVNHKEDGTWVGNMIKTDSLRMI